MSDCPPNPYNSTQSSVSACDGAIDPMGGAVIPDGVVAVELFVNGSVEWETDPEQPSLTLPVLLLSQSSGGILIDEGIYISIE